MGWFCKKDEYLDTDSRGIDTVLSKISGKTKSCVTAAIKGLAVYDLVFRGGGLRTDEPL